MILNFMPKPITTGIQVPLASAQLNVRVAPNALIIAGSFCYYGPVDFGDGIVTNFVPAIYPVGYNGTYSLTNRTACIAAEGANTGGQSYPQAYINAYFPYDTTP